MAWRSNIKIGLCKPNQEIGISVILAINLGYRSSGTGISMVNVGYGDISLIPGSNIRRV